MIYLQLFLVFLKIGAISFGGGYGMISIIRDECLSNGWLNEDEMLNFIAVSESTPGPIAVNLATFVGSSQGGILGAFLATLGVVLPAFLIILLIMMLIKNLLNFAGVKATLSAVRPVVVGLIFATVLTMFLSLIFNLKTVESTFNFDWKGLIIFAILGTLFFVYKKIRKKTFSPIILILISGVLGLLFYWVI